MLATTPKASVVLVATAGARSAMKTLERVRRQSIADRLEVLIVAQPRFQEELDALPAEPLHSLRILPCDSNSTSRARATGVQAARSDFILFIEDHCFPKGETWASALVAALEEGHAAAGPLILNANPDTALSWANFCIDYGAWTYVTEKGPCDTVAGSNSAYRRDALLRFGNRLEQALHNEWLLQKELRRSGATLQATPEAKVEHLNFSQLKPSYRQQLVLGRTFASNRAEDWPGWRRLVYGAAFPAIFAVRLLRAARSLRATPGAHLPRHLPLTAYLLAWNAVGEGIGYLFGDRGAQETFFELEQDRVRFLRAEDRHLALDPGT